MAVTAKFYSFYFLYRYYFLYKSIGTQHQLNYRNGKMFFNFSNGGDCPSGGKYQLHVLVGCDYTLDTNQSDVLGYVRITC